MEYFALSEFACNCGACDGGGEHMRDEALRMFDSARAEAGTAFVVNSGYRCPAHNAEVGGVEGSAHTNGWAADIEAEDSRTRFRVVRGLINAGFNRIGIGQTFVHGDADPAKPAEVAWLY